MHWEGIFMSDIWEKLRTEWEVIRGAPWSFISVVGVIGAAIWFFLATVNQGTISAKDATIQTLSTQVAAYKDKLNGATPDEAKAMIDSLEKKLNEKIAKLEPRHLTKEQRDIISGIISGHVNSNYALVVASDMSCADCKRYANEFISLLPKSNWEISTPSVLAASAASTKGIAVLTPDPTNPLPEADILIKAFSAANIKFDIKAGGDSFVTRPGEPRKTIAELLITVQGDF
jgi:hypothetical protein